jgi:hypothetical protein
LEINLKKGWDVNMATDFLNKGDQSFLRAAVARAKQKKEQAAPNQAELDEVNDTSAESYAGPVVSDEVDSNDPESIKRNKVKKLLQFLRKEVPQSGKNNPPFKPLRPNDVIGFRGQAEEEV